MSLSSILATLPGCSLFKPFGLTERPTGKTNNSTQCPDTSEMARQLIQRVSLGRADPFLLGEVLDEAERRQREADAQATAARLGCNHGA